MKRFSLSLLKSGLAEHFELFLTIAGVLLAMTVTLAQLSLNQQSMALLFLIWLQGLILWAVHRHGCLQRRALVQKLRQTLNDLVNDRLATMLTTAELTTRRISADDHQPDVTIVAAVEHLSTEFESLRAWERRLQLLRA
jgi:hypothetical protein